MNNVFVEESCKHAAKEWADQINGQVHQCLWLGIWVSVSVEKSLEDRLDKAYCWVDATTRDTRGNLDSCIECESDGKSVDRSVVVSAVLVFDLKDEVHKEESHHKFNQEHLKNKLSSIVAAVSWAKLSNVMTSWLGQFLFVLWQPNHGSSTKNAT